MWHNGDQTKGTVKLRVGKPQSNLLKQGKLFCWKECVRSSRIVSWTFQLLSGWPPVLIDSSSWLCRQLANTKTSFTKNKVMYPWAWQKSSALPSNVMMVPYVWPFLGHDAHYPLSRLRIVPSFTDRPSFSEYSSLPEQPLSERCFSLSWPWNGDCKLWPLARASLLLTVLHQSSTPQLGLSMNCRMPSYLF